MRYRYFFEKFEIDFEESCYSCGCVDSQGFPKILYLSYQKAQKAKKDRNWLKIYPCPEKMGFHLSSK